MFPVISKPFYIVASYNVFKVFERIVAPDTFKLELKTTLSSFVNIPWFEVLPVINRLFDKFVYELIVN